MDIVVIAAPEYAIVKVSGVFDSSFYAKVEDILHEYQSSLLISFEGCIINRYLVTTAPWGRLSLKCTFYGGELVIAQVPHSALSHFKAICTMLNIELCDTMAQATQYLECLA